MIYRSILSFCLFVLAFGIKAQVDTLRVLFVGNSFTYFWNVPQLVQAMSEGTDTYLLTEQSTAGGATWKQHWYGEKELTTKDKIQNGSWDYVVLQNHSSSTIDAIDRFNEYGRKFAQLIRANGAEPIYYITWAYESNPLMQEAITSGYVNLAQELEAEFVPVGPVFDKIRKTHPSIDLFFDDKHQSPIGTYVIALSFYKHLTNQSVLGIPDRLATKDVFGQKTYLTFILPVHGKIIRQIIEEFPIINYN